mmetsp:Transcript_5752/g.4369  ORF Transcript_5752/g.4369 Transcript_5752/m.4369 type:complete len:87 (+) Transcript_5752:1089-1349(+)
MFSGRHKLSIHNGRVFIDRDGDAFCSMLSFLRTGKIPLFESKQKEVGFYDELDFWQVPLLPCSSDNDDEHPQTFDPSWCAPTLMLE